MREKSTEFWGDILVLIVAAIEFGVIGLFGSTGNQSALFGWGGAMAALLGYTIGAYAYGNRRVRGYYWGGIGTGLGVSIVTVILNLYIPFGSDIANLAGLNELVGQFAFIAILLTVFVMLATSVRNAPHTDLA